MVGRSVDKKDEIRVYIKARSKLGCSLKKLMTEISTAFGPSCVSYDTVRRWKKKSESGVESINKNFAEGVIAPAGAKVTGATIRMWLLNKFISFLAVLSWKTGLKKMRTKFLVGHIYSRPEPFPVMAISSALTFRII